MTGNSGGATAVPAPTGSFGLPVAVALIMGSIIGVGVFNLPTALASLGPITLVSMALTTVGAIAFALLFAALARRLPADWRRSRWRSTTWAAAEQRCSRRWC